MHGVLENSDMATIGYRGEMGAAGPLAARMDREAERTAFGGRRLTPSPGSRLRLALRTG